MRIVANENLRRGTEKEKLTVRDGVEMWHNGPGLTEDSWAAWSFHGGLESALGQRGTLRM